MSDPIPGPVASETTVDVVVVGSGTGMAAALAAHESGLSVLVIEKTAWVGGSTARSGGAFWIPGNSTLRAAGSQDTPEKARLYLDNVVAGTAPEARYKAFLDQGPAAVAMLERMTPLKFSWAKGYADYHSRLPGADDLGRSCESRPFDLNRLGKERGRYREGVIETAMPMPVTGAEYKWLNLLARRPLRAWPILLKRMVQGIGGLLLGRHYTAGGQAIAGGMFAGLIKAGVPVWTRARMVKLLMDGERAAGVIVEQDGLEVRVSARRGVVLAAGGFDHNMEMRHKHQSPALGAHESLGAEGNTGDAIEAGQGVGADVKLMTEAWWFPAFASATGGQPKVLLAERSLPGSLMVDDSGSRFVNEAMDYMSFGQKVLEREKQGRPIRQMWLVFDQVYRNSYLLAGELFPGAAIPQAWFDAGVAVKADTPLALAVAAGLPQTAFVQSFERFNEGAASGIDHDFDRGATAYDQYYGDPTVSPNPNLRPLGGPLYALKVILSDLGTCGGLSADENARVLREDGAPVEGLYAIGNTAANVFGRAYPGAGATIGQGVTFGFIAARHIAARPPSS